MGEQYFCCSKKEVFYYFLVWGGCRSRSVDELLLLIKPSSMRLECSFPEVPPRWRSFIQIWMRGLEMVPHVLCVRPEQVWFNVKHKLVFSFLFYAHLVCMARIFLLSLWTPAVCRQTLAWNDITSAEWQRRYGIYCGVFGSFLFFGWYFGFILCSGGAVSIIMYSLWSELMLLHEFAVLPDWWKFPPLAL